MTSFHSTEALVDWMQDEGFDGPVLLSCKPTAKVNKPPSTTTSTRKTKPPVLPEVVVLEIGIEDIEWEGDKNRYAVWRLELHDLVHFEATGPLGKHEELSLERAEDVDAPIALRLSAGGVMLLACGRIDVVDCGFRLRTAQPKTWQRDFAMYCPLDTTVEMVLQAVGISGAVLASFGTPSQTAPLAWTLPEASAASARAWRVTVGEREIVALGIHTHGPRCLLSLQRREDATDEEWDHIWKVPITLDLEEISSRTVLCTQAQWATRDWRDGAPQKPHRS